MLRSPVGPFLGLHEAFMRMNVPRGLPEPSQGGRRPGAPDVSLGRLFFRSDKAPFVNAAACVGCGICQYRCHTLYVVQQRILDRSAVRVFHLSAAP